MSRSTRRAGGIDLESYRQETGETYQALGARIGVPDPGQVRRYALGMRWPGPEVAEQIVLASRGRVTIAAMHARHLSWVREHRAKAPGDERAAASA